MPYNLKALALGIIERLQIGAEKLCSLFNVRYMITNALRPEFTSAFICYWRLSAERRHLNRSADASYFKSSPMLYLSSRADAPLIRVRYVKSSSHLQATFGDVSPPARKDK